MREIRFRAWHKVWKRMFAIDCTHYIDVPEYSDPIAWDNEDFEFMQYTGLKDKNGKEIYEGDILGWGDNGREEVIFLKIDRLEIYGHGCNGVESMTGFRISGYYGSPEKCEVIGNRWENPELLK